MCRADVGGDRPVGQTTELMEAVYPGRRLLTTSGRIRIHCSNHSSGNARMHAHMHASFDDQALHSFSVEMVDATGATKYASALLLRVGAHPLVQHARTYVPQTRHVLLTNGRNPALRVQCPQHALIRYESRTMRARTVGSCMKDVRTCFEIICYWKVYGCREGAPLCDCLRMYALITPAAGACACIPCGQPTTTSNSYSSGSCRIASGTCSASVSGAGCYSSTSSTCNCATQTGSARADLPSRAPRVCTLPHTFTHKRTHAHTHAHTHTHTPCIGLPFFLWVQWFNVFCTPYHPVKLSRKLLVSNLAVEGSHFRLTIRQKGAMLTARALLAAGHSSGQE